MNQNQKAINYLQALGAKMIMNANSGHTGVTLGASTIFFALFKDHFRYDIKGQNINRDRFVNSAGHSSALYYATMYMFGFDISMDDLKKFRQIGSKTPGHPEIQSLDAIDSSTGPLGQGVANSVGLAIASKRYSHIFNVQNISLFDNKVYCFCGDGCLMEGVALEAISLAGNLALDNLILLYDKNDATIDGELKLSNSEDVKAKFISQNWHVLEVKDGNDYNQVTKAIRLAKKNVGKPTVIIFNTKIGYNSVHEGNSCIHGKPLTESEYMALKSKLGVSEDFFVPADVLEFCQQTTIQNNEYFADWDKALCMYQNTHPELCKRFMQFDVVPKIIKEKYVKLFDQNVYSGRKANEILLKDLTSKMPAMIGGCADVANSTCTIAADGKFIDKADFRPQNINFGVREHAMGAVCNGIALYGDDYCFCSTFLAFSNYMLPAIRMACMMNLPVWYFFTHDSILIGEDGPTHQPIEQITCLRAIPNLRVFRPCDYLELIDCYKTALTFGGPSAFILNKSNQKVYSCNKISNGAQILTNENKPDVTLLTSGSDVELCFQAKKLLKNLKIDIVSVNCLSMFEKAKQNVRNAYLKGKVIAVEASNDNTWYKFTPNVFNIQTFGHSGKGEDVAKFMGWTAAKLAKYIKDVCNV